MDPTLLLDLDGTLVDTLPDLLASVNRLAAQRGLPAFAGPELRAMIGDGAAVLVQRAMASRGRTATTDDVQTLLDDYTAHAAEGSRLFPGVADGLRAMAAEGWRLAVCTNKPAGPARQVLATLGILDLMAAVGGGDTYPVRKPDPAHLLATLADAGGAAGAAVMVGDHQNDILAASGAAIPSVFAAWGYGDDPTGAAAAAPDFAAVPALAAGLLGLR